MSLKDEHEHLERLLTALDASRLCFKREWYHPGEGGGGDWRIWGKAGHIYADGGGYLLFVAPGKTAKRWHNMKRLLSSFCRVTQDGDDEGCMHLDHLPTAGEAEAIRQALVIRKRRHISPETLAAMTSRLERGRTLDKTTVGDAGLAEV
jgi:hypothetical protein